MTIRREWVPLFFALSACSWMPHWSCHYYRLETGSSFVVGSFAFSVTASFIAMLVYSALIGANLFAVIKPLPLVAITSGVLHLAFAALHAWRLHRPFVFEVLGYSWSHEASLREVAIVGAFGTASVFVGFALTRSRPSSAGTSRP